MSNPCICPARNALGNVPLPCAVQASCHLWRLSVDSPPGQPLFFKGLKDSQMGLLLVLSALLPTVPSPQLWGFEWRHYLYCHLKTKQLIFRKRIASCWVKCVSCEFKKKQESCRAGGRTIRWSLVGALGAVPLVMGRHDEALPQSLGPEPAGELDNN